MPRHLRISKLMQYPLVSALVRRHPDPPGPLTSAQLARDAPIIGLLSNRIDVREGTNFADCFRPSKVSYRREGDMHDGVRADRQSNLPQRQVLIGKQTGYLFGFSAELKTRFTKDWDILNVRAMEAGLIPALNDARIRFALPSGISSNSLIFLSRRAADLSWVGIPVAATATVLPFIAV
jgi:hypothetical protein